MKFTHSGAQGPDWLPQGSAESRRNLYATFRAFIRDASEDLKRRGYACTVEGVFWHIGENDTYFDPYVKNYAGWMRNLMGQIRLDLGQPQLPWFVSEQHPGAPWKHMDAINTAMRTLASNDPALHMVRTAQLPHERVHFGTKGTLLLGEAMAEAYLKRR